MRTRYIALMALLATTLLYAPTASACSLNPTAVISAPAASSSHIHGTGVSFVGTSSTANCGWISAYIWRNGVTILSYSSSFSYNVTLEPEQVDSVITVSLQVNNSYGRSHTVYRTITIKRDHQSQYFVKDHLGSPRVVVDGKGSVLSHTDYYPFGMVMPGRASNISLAHDRVKFTGYLLEEEGGQDTYHAEARGYDPVIGRFTSRDPHASNYPGWSPYHYSANNPILITDPTGLDWYNVGTDEKPEMQWFDGSADQPQTGMIAAFQRFMGWGGYTSSLGENVIVAQGGSVDSDGNVSEGANEATFDLYTPDNKTGPTASMTGNTVSADGNKYATIAAGVYGGTKGDYKGNPGVLLEGGGAIPTTKPNPNSGSPNHGKMHADGIWLHIGNKGTSTTLFTRANDPISLGCQTGCNGNPTAYKNFVNKVPNKVTYVLYRNK